MSVIKKIQEDPSYYVEAKVTLKCVIEQYDEQRTHGGSDLPYTTGYLSYEMIECSHRGSILIRVVRKW